MSYHGLGQPPIPGGWPGFPGGLPGPIAPHPGAPGPNVPANIFPTHTRVGDVVTITGPFGGFGQGQVRVKFQGTSWLSPRIMGPTMASVVVPEGAENGLCEVEINGRRVFGTNCIVEKGTVRVGKPSHAGRDTRAWTQKGERLEGYLGGDMPATLVRTTLILSTAAWLVKKGNEKFNKDDKAIKEYSTWAHWGFMTVAVLGAFGVIHD